MSEKKKKKTLNNKPFSFELCFMACNFLRAVNPCLFDLPNKLCWDFIEMPTFKCASFNITFISLKIKGYFNAQKKVRKDIN